MIVIAKIAEGREFLHSIREMYEAPKSSASKICDVMNNICFRLKEGETWHVYDEYMYEPMGKLSIRNGVVKLRSYYY